MYYYGYNGGYGNGAMATPCCNNGYGGYGNAGFGAGLWIVLFILLVIIIGAGWSWGGTRDHERC